MGVEEFLGLARLALPLLLGYFLGSVPFAHFAARLKGVDIFKTGSTQAGTANVFWNVSRRIGILVFAGDVAKGALAVSIAHLMDSEPPVLVVTGGAAVLGHWKSVFTGFRGGDGMATLLGVTVTLVPVLALPGIIVGVVSVALAWKSPYRSGIGIAMCFTLVLVLSLVLLHRDQQLAVGLTGVAILVLAHNIIVRRRRLAALGIGPVDDFGDLEMDLTEDGDLDSTVPERP